MKKAQFKGTINGKNYDNVNDYNKELNELISKGASVNASSSTVYGDDEYYDHHFDDDCDGHCENCNCIKSTEPKTKLNLYPGFEEKEDYISKSLNMFDKLFKEHKTEKEVTNIFSEHLGNTLHAILDYIDAGKLTDKQLNDYYKDCIYLAKSLDDEIKSNSNELKNIQNQIVDLSRCDFITRSYNNLYNQIIDFIDKYIDKNRKIDSAKSVETSMKETIPQTEFNKTEDILDSVVNQFNNLFKNPNFELDERDKDELRKLWGKINPMINTIAKILE